MSSNADAAVFIVHGRDTEALQALVDWCRSNDITILTFDEVANTMPQPPIISNVVFEGIKRATATIVLLTPDELSVMYAPGFGVPKSAHQGPDARWQARPNVLFEAGIAMGAGRGNTLLVTIGADASWISDLSGAYLLDLANPGADIELHKRIHGILRGAVASAPSVSLLKKRGDFSRYVRKRWDPYDEVAHLAEALKSERIFTTGKESVLDCVRKAVKGSAIGVWRSRSPKDFCQRIEEIYDIDVANLAYWTLFMEGFFKPNDVEQFYNGDGETWRDGVPYSQIAERGFQLIDRIVLGAKF